MESSARGALSLVRLVAAGIILIGVLDGGLYLTQYMMQFQHHTQNLHPAPLNMLRLVLDSIPMIIGIVILVRAKALAEWVEDLIQ